MSHSHNHSHKKPEASKADKGHLAAPEPPAHTACGGGGKHGNAAANFVSPRPEAHTPIDVSLVDPGLANRHKGSSVQDQLLDHCRFNQHQRSPSQEEAERQRKEEMLTSSFRGRRVSMDMASSSPQQQQQQQQHQTQPSSQ